MRYIRNPLELSGLASTIFKAKYIFLVPVTQDVQIPSAYLCYMYANQPVSNAEVHK